MPRNDFFAPRLGLEYDLKALLACRDLHDVPHLGQNADGRERLWFGQSIAGFRMCKIEQLVDQVQQMAAGSDACCNHLVLLFRELHFQQVGPVSDDGVEWRPQFMADAGKKQTFGLVCCFRFFLGLRDLGDQR